MKTIFNKAVSLLLAIIMAVVIIPTNISTAYADAECPVTPAGSVPTGLQADVTFPDWAGYVDDTLLMNGMYSFKAYAGQGELYVTCTNGLQNVNFFINGVKVDLSEACQNNGKAYKVDISQATVNGTNTIQVTNYAPESGKINVKIPYPTVIDGTTDSGSSIQDKLDLIDLMISKDIQYGYTSGQLAVIKDGVMIKDSAYGKLNSYNQDGTRKTDSPNVTTDTMFDLASNTKMYATNYALQKLVSDGKININDKITKYFSDFKDSGDDPIKGKANLTLRNLMEHQGGFPADPQYHNDKFNQTTQKADPNATNPLFSQDKATTLQMILKTPLAYIPGTKTVYSDVDFMLLGFVVEKVTGMPLDKYVEDTFYKPMGLDHIMYNPLQKGFKANDCAATELNGNTRDGAISFQNIRKNTLQGQVHDEKAFYSMGGVSGHAGLFASAEDLAKLCQVMLNGGGYGENKFFDKNTIDEFTKRKDALATWGLGWWREGDNGRVYYFGSQSSSDTFGHQGWTGTLTCIDPVNDLVIVWLTNKINSPVIDNTVNANDFYGNKFTSSTYGSLATMIYDALEDKNKEPIEANLATMVTEKIKLVNDESTPKFKEPIMKAACALTDTLITRAEQRKVKSMVDYSNQAVNELSAVCTDNTIINVFRNRIAAIQAEDDPAKDYSKITSKQISQIPSAQWRADISFPDYMNYVDDTLICNGMFTFKGYAGQGKLYITAKPGVTGAKIFINGVEMNTSQLCGNTGSVYEVDYSKVAVDGYNTIQVTNVAPTTVGIKKGINVKIPYPTVINGTAASKGVDQDKLKLIDTIINNDIKYGFTSAQLAVIKDGIMIKNSAYGKLNSYNKDGTKKTDSPNVTTDTMYDLASNTKMYATNYALQKLVSEGKIGINDKITTYFPDFKDNADDPYKGKADLTLRNLMEHQGGFPADPQYHNDKFNQKTQKADQNATNPLFSQDKATTLQMILKTPLIYTPGTRTLYSDVDFMLLGLVVEKVTGMPLDQYVENTLYKPIGLNHIMYNPLQKGFAANDCAATELNGNTRDGAISFKNIRKNTLQGQVHDEKAFYSMGGVSGHAGLFANAGDLAKLCQVMLNGGGYGENKFFDKNTIDEFTKRKDALATWGLGWWREGDVGRPWYFGVQSSSGTIGHQGWTGTLTMIDPSTNLVVVLLTNKINSPVIDNKVSPNDFYGNKFTTSTLGTITDLVYEAIANTSDEAMDANIGQMVTEKLKLYTPSDYDASAILDATNSLVDTVITRAEERKTSETLAYAKQAVTKLDPAKDQTNITAFNNRISAIENGTKSATITLLNCPSSVRYDNSISLTATVAGAIGSVGIPSGTVQFKSGDKVLGSSSLTNGTAQLQLSASSIGTAGSNVSITATYSGDDKFLVSTSAVQTVSITQEHSSSSSDKRTKAIPSTVSEPKSSMTGTENRLDPGKPNTFTITSDEAPSVTCGNGSIAQLVVLKPWDCVTKTMQLQVCTNGQEGQKTGVYSTVNGKVTLLFVVTVGTQIQYRSDTTMNVTKKPGQLYWFTITMKEKQTKLLYSVGDGAVLQTMTGRTVANPDGTMTYFFGYKCVKPGMTGVYITMNGVKHRVFVGCVS